MTGQLRLAQFLTIETDEWKDANGILRPESSYYYQNFFMSESKAFQGNTYDFAPFRIEAQTNALNGDNGILQILFPYSEYAIKLVEQGNGNRLSSLILYTLWLPPDDSLTSSMPKEEGYYIGIGASFSDTTIELRFRSAIDSVINNFPSRYITRELAGLLPNNAELALQ